MTQALAAADTAGAAGPAEISDGRAPVVELAAARARRRRQPPPRSGRWPRRGGGRGCHRPGHHPPGQRRRRRLGWRHQDRGGSRWPRPPRRPRRASPPGSTRAGQAARARSRRRAPPRPGRRSQPPPPRQARSPLRKAARPDPVEHASTLPPASPTSACCRTAPSSSRPPAVRHRERTLVGRPRRVRRLSTAARHRDLPGRPGLPRDHRRRGRWQPLALVAQGSCTVLVKVDLAEQLTTLVALVPRSG